MHIMWGGGGGACTNGGSPSHQNPDTQVNMEYSMEKIFT